VDSTTDVTVCIPWRATPERLAAYWVVVDWWRAKDFRVILGDSDPALPFNVSAARNAAVSKATTRAVIVADADTIPDLGSLQVVLSRMEEGRVVYPFNRYRYVDRLPDPLDLANLEHSKEWVNSVGGLLVTTPSTYWSVGGFDERFERWGYEDNAFYLAASTLATVARTAGTVYAFGHDADRDISPTNPGKSRIELYRYANRRPDLMRELVMRR
jgi:hypothetical protein